VENDAIVPDAADTAEGGNDIENSSEDDTQGGEST
jgi:hypothetical protein